MNSQARAAAYERAFKEETAACGEVASVIPCPLPIEGGCGVAAGEACKVAAAPAPSQAARFTTFEGLTEAIEEARRTVDGTWVLGDQRVEGGARQALARAVLHLDALAKAERAYRIAKLNPWTFADGTDRGTLERFGRRDTQALADLLAAGGVP